MLELLCKIPENIGWALVGAATTILVELLIGLGKIAVEAIRSRIEDEEEEDECEW